MQWNLNDENFCQVTSEEIVKLYVERIREVNSIINACVDERFDEALDEAKKADKMVRDTSPLYLLEHYPFLGVPFSCKESVGVKGQSDNTQSAAID